MKWITRERPVIDRIACPWLIARFIDKGAEFLFVPPDRVLAVAKETGGTPYDVPGVEFTHVGNGCSFDTFVSKYRLADDPAIATIAAMGLRDVTPDDHEVLKHGFVIYDALYAWASRRKAETHNWPPAMASGAA
jgi:hypothetical protein